MPCISKDVDDAVMEARIPSGKDREVTQYLDLSTNWCEMTCGARKCYHPVLLVRTRGGGAARRACWRRSSSPRAPALQLSVSHCIPNTFLMFARQWTGYPWIEVGRIEKTQQTLRIYTQTQHFSTIYFLHVLCVSKAPASNQKTCALCWLINTHSI